MYISTISQIKKENSDLKDKLIKKQTTGNFDADSYINKQSALQKQNDELKIEIVSLKRIQSQQGNALNKMVNENNYPQKIKGLIDELKYAKEKVKKLDDDLKREVKNS